VPQNVFDDIVVPAEAGIQPFIIPQGWHKMSKHILTFLPLFQSFYWAGFPPPRERQFV